MRSRCGYIPWVLVSLPASGVNLGTGEYPHHTITTSYVSPCHDVVTLVVVDVIQFNPHLFSFGRRRDDIQDPLL